MKTCITLILCVFLFPWPAQSAEYYRWTDESGVSHITDQPPVEKGKHIKVYRFKDNIQPMVPASQAGEDETTRSSEKDQASENRQEQDRDLELEKARQEYEEAKSHETEYRRNFNDSYGYGRDRQHWREKLQDIDNKKQKLDNLESGGSAGESPSTTESSDNSEREGPR
ncbi:MAG TPA: DUF4124 domain-containing protein [Syntrophales bacterium]|nr:DUF4124 domain-containing protein [Syntrophales bacterium]